MQTGQAQDMGRREAAIFTLAVLTMAAWVAVVSLSTSQRIMLSGTTPDAVPQGLGTFTSQAQLQAFVAANAKSAHDYSVRGTWLGGPVWGRAVPIFVALSGTATLAATQSVSFTGTNVQVQGVDEPDRVKTDGAHLFVSNGTAVVIMDAYPPSSAAVVSKITLHSASIIGLEVADGRLLVIEQSQSSYYYAAGSVGLLLYNVTDLASPRLIENMSISGSYVAARMAQGYAYAVIQQPSYQFDNGGNSTGVLPGVIENGTKSTLSPSSVYYTPNRAQISYYTFIVSMSMATGATTKVSVLTGPSSTIYVSTSDIYVVYTNYQEWYADNIPGDVYTGGVISPGNVENGQNSTIVRASYSNGTIAVKAAGAIPGTVLNQFSLDEYSGYLRVATGRFAVVDGAYTRSNDVYVLTKNMTQVSAVRNLAPGENIYAVRFVGDMGYVVTFEQIDPLFAISFKTPTSPVVLSALKVSGYSDYLHPLPGGYLIGVGKDAVPSSTGSFAWYLGLKLSLFRVLDNGTSTQVQKYLIGDRGTESPVLNDHLAFTFDNSRNITILPVLLYQVPSNANVTSYPGSPPPYGDPVWQGVYVLKVTHSGFTLLGRVSQYSSGQSYATSPDYGLVVDRTLVIGGYLYTFSQEEVMVSDLTTFATVATVGLK